MRTQEEIQARLDKLFVARQYCKNDLYRSFFDKQYGTEIEILEWVLQDEKHTSI